MNYSDLQQKVSTVIAVQPRLLSSFHTAQRQNGMWRWWPSQPISFSPTTKKTTYDATDLTSHSTFIWCIDQHTTETAIKSRSSTSDCMYMFWTVPKLQACTYYYLAEPVKLSCLLCYLRGDRGERGNGWLRRHSAVCVLNFYQPCSDSMRGGIVFSSVSFSVCLFVNMITLEPFEISL